MRLSSGVSASCLFRLVSETAGLLELSSALYLPVRESDDPTLTMADGSERSIRVAFGPAIGEGSFSSLN